MCHAGVNDNLVPYTSNQSREEAKKNGRKGGIASGKAKRERKAMKETLEILLNMTVQKGKAADIEGIQSLPALKGKNITVQEAVCVAMLQKAMKGNVPAAQMVRDTIGENPVQKIDADIKNVVPVIGGEESLED